MRNRFCLLLGLTLTTFGASCASGGGDTTAPSESSETLSAGWIAPNFSLAQPDGSRFDLHSESASGPIVLVFYRGHW